MPGDHNFVAADVFVHNTAFGLGIASHVAVEPARPCCSSRSRWATRSPPSAPVAEARVDSTKLRTGKLTEQDWSKIGNAIGRLEAPLFIDDNPNATVMEIRAKARRLKSGLAASAWWSSTTSS